MVVYGLATSIKCHTMVVIIRREDPASDPGLSSATLLCEGKLEPNSSDDGVFSSTRPLAKLDPVKFGRADRSAGERKRAGDERGCTWRRGTPL